MRTMTPIACNLGRMHAFKRVVGSLLLNQVLMKRIARRRAQGHPQLAVFAQDLIGQAINVYGWWEHEQLIVLREFVLARLDRGGAMLDIGANIGNHSIFLRDLFDEVHAVEANPRTFKLLEFNADPHPNLHVHQFAASDEKRLLRFQPEPANVGASRVVERDARAAAGAATIEVQARLIDEAIVTTHRVKLVKLDVEGHELQALRGMSQLLTRDFPCVVFEQLASEIVDGSSTVIDALRAYGYSRFYSIERVPSSRRGGALAQWRSNLHAIWRGLRMQAVQTDHFAPGFYEMIVAMRA